MKTQEEIVAFYRTKRDADLFGTFAGDLLSYVGVEYIREFCKPDADLSGHVAIELTRDAVLKEMRNYMPFALEKAANHRGISASRSVQHFQAWTFLLDEYEHFDWDDYAQYGVPILKAICTRYSFPFPGEKQRDNVKGLENMAVGDPCEAGCDMGC